MASVYAQIYAQRFCRVLAAFHYATPRFRDLGRRRHQPLGDQGLLRREIGEIEFLGDLNAGVPKPQGQRVDRAAVLQPVNRVQVPQIMEAEAPERDAVLFRPRRSVANDLKEVAPERLIILAIRVPEQVRSTSS